MERILYEKLYSLTVNTQTHMYVCTCVCMYVCMHACTHAPRIDIETRRHEYTCTYELYSLSIAVHFANFVLRCNNQITHYIK